jgi:hypothetical protein
MKVSICLLLLSLLGLLCCWCIEEFRPALFVNEDGNIHASLFVLLLAMSVGCGVASFASYIEKIR